MKKNQKLKDKLSEFNNMVDKIDYKKHFIWLLGMFLFSLPFWVISFWS
ncbi:MAG: hypothetical protein J6L86_04975 [Alphaproteobacteria bacterium]|nr:hypothetical protein [Alphaproteobacteria bacterium]